MSSQPLPASPDHLSVPQYVGALVAHGRHAGEPGLGFGRRARSPASTQCYILIADDDQDLLAYLTLIIGEAGYSVQTAANGREALEVCRRDPPALVISDVEMPEMDGLSLLHALRADPDLAGLPVLLSSATINPTIRIAALAAGADDYLDKPIADGMLLRHIAGALKSRAISQSPMPTRRQCL